MRVIYFNETINLTINYDVRLYKQRYQSSPGTYGISDTSTPGHKIKIKIQHCNIDNAMDLSIASSPAVPDRDVYFVIVRYPEHTRTHYDSGSRTFLFAESFCCYKCTEFQKSASSI